MDHRRQLAFIGLLQFGIDAERVPALVREIVASGAEWRGFHIFAGSQALDAAAIVETQAQTIALAARLARESGAELPHCNIGGGFGILLSAERRNGNKE